MQLSANIGGYFGIVGLFNDNMPIRLTPGASRRTSELELSVMLRSHSVSSRFKCFADSFIEEERRRAIPTPIKTPICNNGKKKKMSAAMLAPPPAASGGLAG